MSLLQDLHNDGSTLCMVTHDTRYARSAQRTIHFFDGQVVDGDREVERNLDSEIQR